MKLNQFKENIIELIPFHIRYLIKIYLLGIAFFTFFRFVLFFLNISEVSRIEKPIWIFIQSFWIGFRFDTAISGYLLIIPYLLLTIHSLYPQKIIYNITNLYIGIAYSVAFFMIF